MWLKLDDRVTEHRGILKAPRKVLVTPTEADRKTSTELAGGDGL